MKIALYVTFRCEQSCANCMHLCGKDNLDNVDTDISLEQVDKFVNQIKKNQNTFFKKYV